MNWPHKRIWGPVLLAAGGLAFAVLGFRSLRLESLASARARAGREETIRRDLRADAVRLMRAPQGRPVAQWRVEQPTMVSAKGVPGPYLVGLRAAASHSSKDAAGPALSRWDRFLDPAAPSWVRQVAASHAASEALAARQVERAQSLYELAADAHPALLDLNEPPVRVRMRALGRLALMGLEQGDPLALRTFLTEAEDGVRLVEGDVLGPGRITVALHRELRRTLPGLGQDPAVAPSAADLDRLDRAAAHAAWGLQVLRLLPEDGARIVEPHWGLRRGGSIWLYPLSALYDGAFGEPVTSVRLLPPGDTRVDPASPRELVLEAPFERVVLTLRAEEGGREALVAGLVLALGLFVYAGGAVLVLRGWQRTRLAARQQADFVAAVSHELKTPIASVRAMAELMAAGGVADPDRARLYAERIDVEMQRLGACVRNVLDAAQIERGMPSLSLRPGDPALVLERVAQTVAPALEKQGFDFSWRAEASPRPFLHDAEALEGVLLNFIDNAAKFSGSQKEIRLLGEPTSRGGYLLQVSDRGPGLESAEASRLFERFYRGSAARQGAAPGVGLGLHIAKQVAEAHGAALFARPRAAGGALFGLELKRTT